MYRNLLALLAASASLSVMLLIANAAYAAPIAVQNFNLAISTPIVRTVNLNFANPILNLTSQNSNPILHNLGCTCAACANSSRPPSI